MALLAHSGTATPDDLYRYMALDGAALNGTSAGYSHTMVAPSAPPSGLLGLLIRLLVWLGFALREAPDPLAGHQARMATSDAWLQEAIAYGERIKSWPSPAVVFRRTLMGDADPYRKTSRKPRPPKLGVRFTPNGTPYMLPPYALAPHPGWASASTTIASAQWRVVNAVG